jgi:hypothetical protein
MQVVFHESDLLKTDLSWFKAGVVKDCRALTRINSSGDYSILESLLLWARSRSHGV